MAVATKLSLAEIAQALEGDLRGDGDTMISGVAPLPTAKPHQIGFLSSSRYRRHLEATEAGAVILSPRDAEGYSGNAVVVAAPYLGYAKVARMFHPEPEIAPGIHPGAVVSPEAEVDASAVVGAHCVVEEQVWIGADVRIGAGSFVGRGSRLGAGTRLMPNVTICHGSVLGERVLVHPGVVIGSDGFGYANEDGRWLKIPQVGRVRIGNDVEIGANTTIDRGALEDTVIEDGVILDNQIQVAHNVHIGAHTAVAGCVGIAGSARIGRYCTLAGGVGIVGHIEIADHVHVTGMSMVTKSIAEPGVYSAGTPLEPNRDWHRNSARFKHLDAMARRLKKLEKQVESLSSRDQGNEH